ncbi:SMP-30/gluconolactonase/LRE family protein [Paenibacillus sp. ATY16]|uniref:SMP-30/gluconolactonase/LRE family protein n=1 Tax=Paenibacillus sp. ATY16 TaxID=1759312 RepID=UPI00200C462C|nr:SMP-30/gluconolactonase/LRE family protein [Paenibacillus sp. ATY16]MCK9860877.1 SMP-30/gluconolactonase/LRE family protein [Paenibacillus sp. ATY16]
MKKYEAKCLLNERNELGEGPVWDERLQELLWVDIEGRQLHRYRPSDGRKLQIETEKMISAAVPAEDGTWLIALADGFYRLNLETGDISLIARTEEETATNRLNDGKCDPAGRFWAGTMISTRKRNGHLYVLEDGKLSKRLSGIGCSNGLAWTADGTVMYYIDTFENEVYAFDYDVASGQIANRRIVIRFPEGEGSPDGMSIDSEGMLWIGHWGGWQIGRWNPLTGEKLATIPIPVRNVTSCAFGGENLDELYITTARIGNDKEQLEEQPLAGAVFRVKLDVKGLPVQRARG